MRTCKPAAFAVLGMFVLVMSMGAMAQEQPVTLKSTDSAGQNEWARVEVTNSTAAGAGNPAYVRLPRLADASAEATLRNSALLELQSAYWTGSTTGNYSFLLQAMPTATSPAAKLSFLTRDNAGTETERMVLTNNGYLGVGTGSPAYPVDIASNSASLERTLNVSKTGGAPSGYGYATYSTCSGSSVMNYGTYGVGSGGSVAVGVGGSASGGSVNYAGYFIGDIFVVGNVGKLSSTFVIDHPLDPDNKILRHSMVESPDMKNIYDGVVVLDKDGKATITLPTYFQALNKDFRYQLTPVGKFAQLYVAMEVADNKFSVAAVEGAKAAGTKVSWQVTGIRQDKYALDHPLVVEEVKVETVNGFEPGKSITDMSKHKLNEDVK